MPQSIMAKRKSGGLLESVKTIVYAALIAVAIRTIAFEPFNIPSGSMIPTLLIGDYLFVSKYSYGYSRYSLPFAPDLFEGRIFKHFPKRGDVAVFKNPHQTSIDYIKRIVGLPGDRIQVKGGQLYVNGNEVPRTLITRDFVSEDEQGVQMQQLEYRETLPGGREHLILKADDQGRQGTFPGLDPNNTPEFLVPENHLFAMGDNRDNSQDSRFQNAVGFVPMDNLVGRAEFIFFSVDATAPWWEVWEWPFEIRWSRLFTGIT
jgi:signal peptidase I